MSRLQINTAVKVSRVGDRVYSEESYAQDLYDLFTSKSEYSQSFSKSVSVGTIVTINRVDSFTDSLLHVSSEDISGICIKVSKEKEFFNSIGMTPSDFAESIDANSGYSVIITEAEPTLKGSLHQATVYMLKEVFEKELKNATTVFTAKVTEKNKGGYFVNINGIVAFMPGSLAAPNKIINFDALIGKNIKVMVDSYIPESDTYIVSHKKYIANVLDSEIENIDFSKKYTGEVTGSIDKGIFVEFNEIMTGMLFPDEMSTEIRSQFESRNIHPGEKIEVWVKDIQFRKNFVLTQHDMADRISALNTLYHAWKELGENQTIYKGEVLGVRHSIMHISLNDTDSNTYCSVNLRDYPDLKGIIFKRGDTVKVSISNIIPNKNIIDAKLIIQ